MGKFINHNWINLVQIGIYLLSVGFIYGTLKTQIEYDERMIEDIKHTNEVIQSDVKTLIEKIGQLK